LSDDGLAGFTYWFTTYYGAKVYKRREGNKIIVREVMDVTPVLDRNTAMSNENAGWSKDKAFRRMASIPYTVLDDFRSRGIDLLRPEFEKDLNRVMNDPDYSRLRTAHWRV
jgi:hypothetical protein